MRLPVTETKIIETGSPERGDVIVFRLPSDPSINYIKRVIGLPGDEIVYQRQRLIINGEAVNLDRGPEASSEAPVFVEDLDGRLLAEKITYYRTHPACLQAMAAKSESFGKKDAAEFIVNECYELIEKTLAR